MSDLINIARKVIQIEVDGLLSVMENINESFLKAVEHISKTDGRVIICGMGKSGIIGKKIAASFASTGTPSFFMHPGEAFHGDLGMVKPEDVFLAISNSGETDEVLKLLPFLRDNENYLIAMTGNPSSTLAKHSHCHLNISVPQEACPHQLAPTSSTTATLVMGDALTVALMEYKDFMPEQFARFHPGGILGRRLLSKVKDEMVEFKDIPCVEPRTCFKDLVSAVSGGRLGLALVNNRCEGPALITDGDLRRAMESHSEKVFDLRAFEICTKKPKSISMDASLETAYNQMSEQGVSSLVVLDKDNVVGLLKK
ncbi:KpsF/GutQ family sugar-phosphate isomerase [Vibrio genomosp. F6]|uniref:Arabinose 5-phosphate isomerase n=1 Tax=Vibrio genomosp. F6 str. FF-238 TaxID=1191298 RepID=A0A1E5D2G0_9VIBR|nr:KpsF/GutQ family sugar-phosphate isomerase [Vibrio genomosp. F6]OEE77708.1 arabinose-5-phosphate isomerase [Vibrio genomosp. F6 str. FF-238]